MYTEGVFQAVNAQTEMKVEKCMLAPDMYNIKPAQKDGNSPPNSP
jgi:hypothetical protein